MKAILASLAGLLLAAGLFAQDNIKIIPRPASITQGRGIFIFSAATVLDFKKKDAGLQTALAPLISKCKLAAGLDLLNSKPGEERRRPSLIRNAPANTLSVIEVRLDKDIPGEEAYRLTIEPDKIRLSAKTPVGIFYGVQSLLQLLPEAIEQSGLQTGVTWSVPCGTILDSPRFGYRGVMLDVARHYMPLEFLRQLIDLLAMQKMNRLHLHLTDSQGWRFESKKYPKLTQIGAWRKGEAIDYTYDYASRPADTLNGGFYTQEQLKDLVQYAASRYITIIPEIEMPAHSRAALASYPEYACLDSTGKAYPYPAQIQDEYCTKDSTFQFLTDILGEVMEVFPSHYIHVAGDEASKVNWRSCPLCRQRMRELGLKNVEELQSYFITRIEKFVNSRGRSIIGWDEILQGGLAPNATVMSWTGIQGGIKAARQHHTVIMTPEDYCYLDHYQSDAPGEQVAFGGLTTLAKAYSYDPVPAELTKEEAGYILGTQGNLWTEYIPNPAKAEYMIFPRAIALAETGWTPAADKNYENFTSRLTSYLRRLDAYHINYSRHLFDIHAESHPDKAGGVLVTLGGVPEKYRIHYTLDGSLPSLQSPVYNGPLKIRSSSTLHAAVLSPDNRILDQLQKSFVLHMAAARPVTLLNPPSPNYNKGGNAAWANGALGNDQRFADDEWLGWDGQAFDGTIDFGQETPVTTLHTRFFHKPSSWIWMPKKITVLTSADGTHFTPVAGTEIPVPSHDGAIPVSLSWPRTSTRWLRIQAEPNDRIPAGYPGAGTPAWLFADEMVVDDPAAAQPAGGTASPGTATSATGLDIQHYSYNLTLSDAGNTIRGVADITIRFTKDLNSFPLDLVKRNAAGRGMLVQSVTENGRKCNFTQDSAVLYIHSPATRKSLHTYTIRYSGIPMDGLIISANKYGGRTFFGDNWPDRAHHWLPCQDHPSDKATVDFAVTAPDHYQVVANGLKVKEVRLPGHLKQTVWKESAPLYPSVMVIGVADFAIDHPATVKDIPVYSYVFPQNKARGFQDYAYAPDILKYYIKTFGPFAYEKLANVQSKTIFGGMENASAIFYFENSVGSPGVEPLMAHEIAHQWFGDAVTEMDWQHLWLSEGFATYLTLLYMEQKYGADTLRSSLRQDRENIFAFEQNRFTPVVDTTVHGNYAQLLNANSYQKGGWVLHMLRRQIGDSLFLTGLSNYFAAFKNGNAVTADFERIMEAVSGRDLKTFFTQWLYSAGHPQLRIGSHYDPDHRLLRLTVDQEQADAFSFPLEIAIDNKLYRVEVKDKHTEFSWPMDTAPGSVVPDPMVNLLASFK